MIGAALLIAGTWLFFDSVRFATDGAGVVSGALGGGRGAGRGMQTTSMGIILVPLFIGIIALFFDYRKKWAWVVTVIGLVIIGVEVVSRFRPFMQIKSTTSFS